MHFIDVERSCKISGGSVYLLLLAEGLVARGHRFTLAARQGPLAQTFTEVGARYLNSGLWPLSLLSLTSYTTCYPADVYLCSHRGRARLAALHMARRQRKPCICLLHDPLWPHETVEDLLRPTLVVTMEEPVREQVIQRGLAPERVRLWPRPVRTREFAPPPREGFEVLYLGRLSESKLPAAAAAIRAFGEFSATAPQAHLTVAGDGGKAADAAQVASEVNARLGREAVTLVGQVLDPLAWMERAHLVLGGGYSCLEAVYNGRPGIGMGFGWFGPVTGANAAQGVALHFGDRCEDDGRPTAEPVLQALQAVYANLESDGERSLYQPRREWFPEDHTIAHTAELMENLGRELLEREAPA